MTEAAAPSQRVAELLAWSYRGEVAGEVLFETLAVGFADAGHTALLERLAELERLMAAALRAELVRHGVDGGDDERSRARGAANASAVLDGGWDAFLPQFEPTTEHALARYRELRSLAGPEQQICELLIAHEDAIQAVGRGLTAGETDALVVPVDAVIERLRGHIAVG